MTTLREVKQLTQLHLLPNRYNKLYLEWIQLMEKDPKYRLGQHICNQMLSNNEAFSELYYLEDHIELFNYITLINPKKKKMSNTQKATPRNELNKIALGPPSELILEDWYITKKDLGHVTIYLAHGIVFNHPRLDDGRFINTSQIVWQLSEDEILTISGSRYKLGTPKNKEQSNESSISSQ